MKAFFKIRKAEKPYICQNLKTGHVFRSLIHAFHSDTEPGCFSSVYSFPEAAYPAYLTVYYVFLHFSRKPQEYSIYTGICVF